MLAINYADRKPVIVYKTDSLAYTAKLMFERNRFHALVLDEDNLLWGVVSSRDIARALFMIAEEGIEILEGGDLGKIVENPIYHYASHPPIVADKDVSLEEAVGIMASKNIGCLPLLDGERLVGMIDEKSLSRALPEYSRLGICEIASWSPISVSEDEDILAAAGLMLNLGIRRLLVTNGEPGLISINTILEYIFDEKNIEKLLSGDRTPVEAEVGAIKRKPWLIDCSYSLREVASIITFDPLGAVLVVDNEKERLGIITERDLMIALAGEIIR